jgi:phosphoinositide-3-kinase, regulatory subunit 4
VIIIEGNDPGIKHLLERIYLDTYREPLPEFGNHVKEGIPRRRAIRSFPVRERTPRRPEGTLIAHLAEHKDSINSLSVSPDHLFFVTGSDDGTVKVWDTTRIERNVTSRSRHTYQLGGKVTSTVILENSHCIASATDEGFIYVHRVDVNLGGPLPKYGKQRLIRQHKIDPLGSYATCLLHYNTGMT